MACDTLQQKTTHNGGDNTKLKIHQRQEASGECICNPGKLIQGVIANNTAKSKGCHRHYFDMCCVAQHVC